MEMKMHAVLQLVEHVEELNVVIEMELTVVLEISQRHMFVDPGKMHLASSIPPKVNEYC